MKQIFKIILVFAVSVFLLACEEVKVKVESITVTPATLTLMEGESAQLSAAVAPENADYSRLFWHSSNDEVAVVTADGVVTAVKEGDGPVKIIASGGMKAGYCLLTVNAPIVDVTGVSFDPETAQIYVGETYQLEPIIAPANASNKSVTYKSSNEEVATVGKASGLVTGVAPGQAVITVKTADQGKTADFTITVSKGPQGLDPTGTANSYIVTEAGEFFFTPTKGCSDVSVGTIASVSVLWETVNTTTAPEVGEVISYVKYEKDKIWFKVEKAGNAAIAAKDANETILWSWHIWATLEPVGEVAVGSSSLLDRNIGALTSTGDLSSGLMFQWGRKDPFLGSDKPASGGVMIKATATLNSSGPKASTEEIGTMEYTIANPMQWIQSVAASAWDWYYKKLGDDFWKGDEKTIYDPCPAGYMVPASTVWTGITTSDLPHSGRLGGAGSNWNAAPGTATSYWLSNCKGDGNTQAQALVFANATTACSIGGATRGLGCPVRCVKIK